MENQINIAEILKDKPEGTKLYDYLRNIEVEFDTISKTEEETVVWCLIQEEDKITHLGYSEFGKLRGCDDGLTILLPSKSMRDWSKFAWKKGDVLVTHAGWGAGLFEGFANEDYTKINLAHYYVRRLNRENNYIKKATFNTDDFDIGILDSAEKYISAIEKRLEGKLNMETLEVEPIKPKWTPKPFDKVIVRDEDSDTWVASLFSHMKGNRFVTINCSDGFGYCLPYNEETAKLIGTTDSYDEN